MYVFLSYRRKNFVGIQKRVQTSHRCSSYWGPFYYLLMCLKPAKWVANSVNPDQMPSGGTHFFSGLHVWPQGKFCRATFTFSDEDFLHVINSSSIKDLQSLQTVGAKRAKLIFDWRETYGSFSDVSDFFFFFLFFNFFLAIQCKKFVMQWSPAYIVSLYVCAGWACICLPIYWNNGCCRIYIGKQRRSCSDYLDAQADLGTCHLHRTRALFLHCTSSGPSCSKLNEVVS